MPNKSADILFQLIKSLKKAEKRHFKLYIKRNSANEDLKIVRLFDAIDKAEEYDEKSILKKLPGTEKRQLYNLKAHLYKQIMASLRLLKSDDSIDLQMNEQFDYAHILYKKGLYSQSLRQLEKVKETAIANQKFNTLVQVNSLEKRIVALNSSRTMQQQAEELAMEAIAVAESNVMIARLSNLALQMYSWFIKNGHAYNEEEETAVKKFFNSHLLQRAWVQTGFYEKMYLYQSLTWSAFIRQDFLTYYRYTQKWVDLFEEQPLMKRVETGNYIKGVHNLLNAHFDLLNYQKLDETLTNFKAFSSTPRVQDHDNFRVQAFIYVMNARLNQHFITGTFKEGIALIPQIKAELEENALFLESHRVMVFNYKIAMLYFGSGDPQTCIDYLQPILQEGINMRNDLQVYTRILHLLAHYDMDNYSIIESLSKSVYRFLARMQKLSVVEQEILRFLRNSFHLNARQLRPELEKFLVRLKELKKIRYATRTFAYIDLVSWVESKLRGKTMSDVIHEKYLANKRQAIQKNIVTN